LTNSSTDMCKTIIKQLFFTPWSPCKILDKLCGGKKVSSWSNQVDCQTPA
jgi:hypothetical protein